MPFLRTLVARAAGVVLLASLVSPALAQGEGSRAKPSTRLDPSIIAEFQGTKAATRPSRDAIMGFSLPTSIREILVRGGEEVKAGDILIKGDDLEDLAVLRLQQAKAQYDWQVQRAQKTAELAKLEYEKTEKLRKEGGANQLELDRARLSWQAAELDYKSAQVNQAQEEIQVERLQARVDKFHLRAPFDGQVDNVLVDLGHAVNESDKVIRVVNVDPLWMDVPAPTDDPTTLSLQVGDKAWVLLDMATGARISEGKVIEVSPTTDLASRSRRIRVELPNPKGPNRVLAGEPAWVRFSPPSAEVVAKVAAADAERRNRATASK
jgi:multidrug efflux system membrane fusion protein